MEVNRMKRKWKSCKRIFSLLLALCMILPFSACDLEKIGGTLDGDGMERPLPALGYWVLNSIESGARTMSEEDFKDIWQMNPDEMMALKVSDDCTVEMIFLKEYAAGTWKETERGFDAYIKIQDVLEPFTFTYDEKNENRLICVRQEEGEEMTLRLSKSESKPEVFKTDALAKTE